MGQDIPLGTDVGLDPGGIVLDEDLAPHEKGDSSPHFRPTSIVAKRSPISPTAELLFTAYRTGCECVHVSVCNVGVLRLDA